MKRNTRISIILGVALLAVAIVLFLPPVHQPREYHDFADQRSFLGVPDFLNVASSLLFVLVGAWGLWGLFAKKGGVSVGFVEKREKLPWAILFAGTFLTGLGSVYYHWMPSDQTLFWDRLPMTLITMGLLSAVISERISLKAGMLWLGPLAAAGMLSVFYWVKTGDLGPYGLIQFLPLLLIPLVILLFAPRYTGTAGYFGALGWYLLSRLAEVLDSRIYAIGELVSGHTIKHLLAAIAIYWLYRMLALRKVVPELRGVAADGGDIRDKPRKSR